MNQGFTSATGAIGILVEEFNKLPGIGPKSAQRIALGQVFSRSYSIAQTENNPLFHLL